MLKGNKPIRIKKGAVAGFMGRVLKWHAIEISGDGTVVREYAYVKDVVEALVSAVTYGSRSSLLNIGCGVGVSLLELLCGIEQTTGKRADIFFYTPRGFDVPRNVLNIAKASAELGWNPKVSISEGLKRTENWMQGSFH